jgi:hydroxypyruvate isomerase
MRRREFVGTCIGAAVASPFATAGLASPSESREPAASGPPFKLSVMLWTVYEKLPFEQRLEKVAEAGYHAVELVNEFKDWKKEQFAAARAKKRQLGIEFDGTCGIWPTFADANDREKTLKALEDFIPTMKELECTRMITQTGNKVPGLSEEQMRANCIETLKRVGDIAAKNNIEILVENIDPEENPKYFLLYSSDGFEIVRSVGNPHVKFLYDFYHEQIAAGNLIEKLEKNIGLDYESIFRKLAQLKYSGYAAMEFMPQGDPIAELRAAREMATKFGTLSN